MPLNDMATLTEHVLAPEHLADLQRSGLSDETIAKLAFQAVRPHDMNEVSSLTGVRTAYRIPYHSIDGQRLDFARWKLFPAITRKGHKVKYHQAAGTDSLGYFPPLLK
jgi:hypothetical protein